MKRLVAMLRAKAQEAERLAQAQLPRRALQLVPLWDLLLAPLEPQPPALAQLRVLLVVSEVWSTRRPVVGLALSRREVNQSQALPLQLLSLPDQQAAVTQVAMPLSALLVVQV